MHTHTHTHTHTGRYDINKSLYFIHVELAHIKNAILDWNEIRAWGLHHCAALIKVAKSLAPLNVIGHGKVLYQKTSAKVYGAWHIPAYSVMY